MFRGGSYMEQGSLETFVEAERAFLALGESNHKNDAVRCNLLVQRSMR